MPGGFGVYVHVPFCATRCDYCAFATWTDRDHLMADYAAACVAEITRAEEEETLPPATSIFVGGGTPSRLPGELLAGILHTVARTEGAEVTAECNPEGASAELFACWRAAGVTRVSFGVQSMVPHVLTGLGRHHDPATVAEALSLAAGFGFALNVDLIFGAPSESDADWQRTLEAVLALEPRPDHVSAYALTVEPGTPLARDPQRHPDPDVQARRYETADRLLRRAGLRWYEVSNWAVPGHECRHNQLYWRQGDYRGVGCAAHSHRGGRRWWNIRTPERYVSAISSGRPAMAGEEVLDEDERALEALALAVRTAEGVPEWAVADDPELRTLVRRRHGRAVLTLRGRLLADEVARRLRVPSILPA
ncbi:MAG TPA: radical SAM family heme chaperone HemW [Acidimicrobiales bacterium]|nr:radical SAM family heme chaperone HemW [Acidimicrobiales bacterium]